MSDVPKPKMLETPDLTDLKRKAQRLVDNGWGEDEDLARRTLLHEEDVYKDMLFNEVMKTFFGPNFYDLYNERVGELEE